MIVRVILFVTIFLTPIKVCAEVSASLKQTNILRGIYVPEYFPCSEQELANLDFNQSRKIGLARSSPFQAAGSCSMGCDMVLKFSPDTVEDIFYHSLDKEGNCQRIVIDFDQSFDASVHSARVFIPSDKIIEMQDTPDVEPERKTKFGRIGASFRDEQGNMSLSIVYGATAPLYDEIYFGKDILKVTYSADQLVEQDE